MFETADADVVEALDPSVKQVILDLIATILTMAAL